MGVMLHGNPGTTAEPLTESTGELLGLSTPFSQTCKKDLAQLEAEEARLKKKSFPEDNNQRCKKGTKLCKLAVYYNKSPRMTSRCFPASCKDENIIKDIKSKLQKGESIDRL